MTIEVLKDKLTVCKIGDISFADLTDDIFFLGKTDEEISLVCKTQSTPASTLAREDGWRGFRISGELDFSLIGILSKIAALLADNGISIFAVSTYNTDYILVKEDKLQIALDVLKDNGIKTGKD